MIHDKSHVTIKIENDEARCVFVERGTTLFLKVVVILIGIPVAALCVFVIPEIGNFMAELYPEHAYLKRLVFLDLYATAPPYYFALYQAYTLLNYIDRNEAFSELSVRALNLIKWCALAISALFVLGMPLFYLLAERDDAPGIILIGMAMVFASLVIAVFAAVLQKLLKNVIAIKSENDLTV